MVFSSSLFLFIFIPSLLLLYYQPFIKSRKFKNSILLIYSIIFYWFGEPIFVFIMLLLIFLNWIIGLLIDKYRSKTKLLVIISCIINLSVLFIFKYLGFFTSIISNIIDKKMYIYIALPIGISFFTFQIMSYIFDLAKGKVCCQKNLFNLALYTCMFPQLVAGPIVRYETVDNEIMNRVENWDDFCNGLSRFIIGLSKKLIIANNIAVLADLVFQSDLNEISATTAWLGAIAYTIQIYFDFSGYSDMAIGLGKMFGFHFNENFNYPYISKSISEFWRRWHISMGTWFKDYVYIPLGGSKVNRIRIFRNLLIVWLLTGLWHGANWNFIVWGLMYFVLISFEKIFKLDKNTKKIGNLYTMLFVIIGWVIFRSSDLSYCVDFLKVMFGFGKTIIDINTLKLFIPYMVFILFGIIFSLPLGDLIRNKNKKLYELVFNILLLVLFGLDIIYIIKSGYSPFIYFNF